LRDGVGKVKVPFFHSLQPHNIAFSCPLFKPFIAWPKRISQQYSFLAFFADGLFAFW